MLTIYELKLYQDSQNKTLWGEQTKQTASNLNEKKGGVLLMGFS